MSFSVFLPYINFLSNNLRFVATLALFVQLDGSPHERGFLFLEVRRTEGGSKIIKINIFELRYLDFGYHVLHQIWQIPAEFIKRCHYSVYLKKMPVLSF